MVIHLLRDLGLVGFSCSTVYQVLPRLMGNWQKWLCSRARRWTTQPNPGLPADESPCTNFESIDLTEGFAEGNIVFLPTDILAFFQRSTIGPRFSTRHGSVSVSPTWVKNLALFSVLQGFVYKTWSVQGFQVFIIEYILDFGCWNKFCIQGWAKETVLSSVNLSLTFRSLLIGCAWAGQVDWQHWGGNFQTGGQFFCSTL